MARAAGAAPAAGRESAGGAALTRRGFARGAAAAAALALGSAALGALGAPGAALADGAPSGQAAPAGGIDTSTEGEQTFSEAGLLYVARDGYAVVAGPDGDAPEALAIPSELGGLPVLAVGDGAFYSRPSLVSVELPESLESIGEEAFGGCLFLTSVSLPASLVSIGVRAFSVCDSLASVELPASLASIGDSAFSYCRSLATVELPASVASVSDTAFLGCSSLASIDVDPGNAAYASVDGVLFSKDMTALLAYPEGRPGESYDVPEGVEEIGACAFAWCDSLASLTIPASVTSIGNSAFEDCNSLTSVVLPDSLTSIGDGAFFLCDSLTSVTILASVTHIGDRAFMGCPVTLTVERGSYAEEWAEENGVDAIRYLVRAFFDAGVDDAPYEEDLSWGWDLFERSANVYSRDLALAALYLAEGTYKGAEGSEARMAELGFGAFEPHDYDSGWPELLEVNAPACTFGSALAQVGGETRVVVAAAVRGSTDAGDWGTDLLSSIAGGNTYYEASAHVAKLLRAYIDGLEGVYGLRVTADNLVVFVTGHSLGGAVAGNLGRLMSGNPAPQSRVFSYTFASPQYRLYDAWERLGALAVRGQLISGAEWDNVNNTVNLSDVVPTYWPGAGFGRYGTDYFYDVNLWAAERVDDIVDGVKANHSTRAYLRCLNSSRVG